MSDAPALLVDLGNTRVKWALLRDGALGPASAVVHAGVGIAAALRPSWGALPRPGRVLVGSVAGTARDDELRRLCRELWACEPELVAAVAQAAGVTSGYDSPDRLGVDRWLALLAAHADRRGAACVVDCGTAVTIDLLDAAGRHRGGLILPGLGLMRDCLLSRTRIPPVAPPQARADLGRDTGAAIANGALLAIAGAVRETLARATDPCGSIPRLVVAGGDAAALAALFGATAELRPDLVLEGLAVLAGTEET